MKKFVLAFATLLIGLNLLVPATAGAVDVLDPVCRNQPNATVCGDNQTSGDNPIFGPDGIMTTIMGWLARIIGLAAVISIFISGFMMIGSSGDSSSASTARNALMYSIIGLAVAALAQVIVSFVLKKL